MVGGGASMVGLIHYQGTYLLWSFEKSHEDCCIAEDTEGPDDDHVDSGRVVHPLRDVRVLSVAPVVGIHH
jgi:hypothetical protein